MTTKEKIDYFITSQTEPNTVINTIVGGIMSEMVDLIVVPYGRLTIIAKGKNGSGQPNLLSSLQINDLVRGWSVAGDYWTQAIYIGGPGDQDSSYVPQQLNQVNSDWLATSGPAKILNKPEIPGPQVNSDWNAISGPALILNKPPIPSTTGFATEAYVDAAVDVVDDALFAHEQRQDNPHFVTKAQIGLEFAENTTDMEKPVSTAQAAADAATLASANAYSDAKVVQTITSGDISHSSSSDALYNALLGKIGMTELNAHINQSLDAHDASAISSDPLGLVYLLGETVQTVIEEVDEQLVANLQLDKSMLVAKYQTGLSRVDIDISALTNTATDVTVTGLDNVLFKNAIQPDNPLNLRGDFTKNFGTLVWTVNAANTALAANTRGVFYLGVDVAGTLIYRNNGRIIDQDTFYVARVIVDNNAGVYSIINAMYYPDIAKNDPTMFNRYVVGTGEISESGAASISFRNFGFSYTKASINYATNKNDPNYFQLPDSVGTTPFNFYFLPPNVASVASALTLTSIMAKTTTGLPGGAATTNLPFFTAAGVGASMVATHYQIYRVLLTVNKNISIQAAPNATDTQTPTGSIALDLDSAKLQLSSAVFTDPLPIGDSIEIGRFYLRANAATNGSDMSDDTVFFFKASIASSSSSSAGVTAHSALSGRNDDNAFLHATVAQHTNWDTAFADRNKWDGGPTGLVPATGRASLGGTVIGQSIFTSANPSAVTFLRANADNSISWLDAAAFRTAIGAGTGIGNVGGGGSGVANQSARWVSATDLGPGSFFDNGTNVGLGTLVPTAKMHLNSASGTTLKVDGTGVAGDMAIFSLGAGATNNAAAIYVDTNTSANPTYAFQAAVKGSRGYVLNGQSSTTSDPLLFLNSNGPSYLAVARIIHSNGPGILVESSGAQDDYYAYHGPGGTGNPFNYIMGGTGTLATINSAGGAFFQGSSSIGTPISADSKFKVAGDVDKSTIEIVMAPGATGYPDGLLVRMNGTTYPGPNFGITSAVTVLGNSNNSAGFLMRFDTGTGNTAYRYLKRPEVNGNLAFSVTMTGSNAPLFNVDDNGNIHTTGTMGIGTFVNPPQSKLHVIPTAETANPTVRIGESSDNPQYYLGLTFYNEATGGWGGKIQAIQANTPAIMRINPDGGHVGINRNNPIYHLDVAGDIAFNFGGAIRARGNAYDKVIESSFNGTLDYTAIYTAGGGAANQAPKIMILNDGRTGIGVPNPGHFLDVYGNASFTYHGQGAAPSSNYKIGMRCGTFGDFDQGVIILHPIYEGTLMPHYEAIGTFTRRRGHTGAGLVAETYNVNTSTAYAVNYYGLDSIWGSNRLYTFLYQGIRYVGLLSNSQSATEWGYDGYIAGDGNALRSVIYNANGTILDPEINSSLAEVTSYSTRHFNGAIVTQGNAGIISNGTVEFRNGMVIGLAGAINGPLAVSSGIAIGDSDTGFRQNGDGVLEVFTNGVRKTVWSPTAMGIDVSLSVNGDITAGRVTGVSPGGWIGGVFGGNGGGDRVVIGNNANQATIGSHNDLLNAWANLWIQPNGNLTTFGGSISAGGSITASSDLRLKENIKPLKNSLERILRLQGITYDRNDIVSKGNIGFGAQDLEKEFPELVITDNSFNKYKSVNYQAMTPILTEGIKELYAIISDQQNQINDLRKLINLN